VHGVLMTVSWHYGGRPVHGLLMTVSWHYGVDWCRGVDDCVVACVCLGSRDIEVLTGDKQECDGHVEKLKTSQLVLQSKCVFVLAYLFENTRVCLSVFLSVCLSVCLSIFVSSSSSTSSSSSLFVFYLSISSSRFVLVDDKNI